RRLAIVLDGRIYSAPSIREAINGGRAEITGNFTPEEARRLAGVIASGNLPVSIDITSEFGTDPTLGADSIRSGVRAGLLGLALILVFMLWYYKFAGFVADLALIFTALLVFGTMAISKATITMPGLAGMVLTIGMAVDANVLIFERIREELNSGKTLANSVTAGYERAFWCIVDSNITTLVTCFFLYRFGTGSVKGFAVTLAFGIFASMFTALFMTHALFDLMTYKEWLKNLSMRSFGWFKNPNYDFSRIMRAAIIISLVFVAISLVTMIVRRHSLMGIDFTGGTQFTYDCQGENPDVQKVRNYLKESGYGEAKVGYKRGQGGSEELEITLAKANEDANFFSDKLDTAFPECKIKLSSTYVVGGSVGAIFRNSAITATLLSFLGIIIYLSFRFEFIYGLGAVVAVIHDVVVSAGMFFLFNQGQLSLTVVAALMTIIGYSLNDTIVIYDRVRETQGLYKGRTTLLYHQLISQSINQTLSRTMLTTLTTMLAVVTLLVFGGGVIFDFAIVMFYGMISGTYSSNFLATAFINSLHKPTLAEQKLLAKQNVEAKKA
ncbi:MAG: protein translocase subunit SecD, partial [Victivallales bacterium]|nr:protein translocase subunit SecD [Victivallales bacterium]